MHAGSPLLQRFLDYQRDFDGHDAQRFFASHPLLPIATIVAYLLLVRYGVRAMESRPPFQLICVSRLWNLSVAIFSLCGAAVCVPHLLLAVRQHGFWYSVCADVYELAGYGIPALWASLFTWSKLFELVDTVLLIAKKRPVITLHWFHHASVIGFAWSAWVYETPCALWYGAMNYSVHAIMYTYFCLTGIPKIRSYVLRVAPIITVLQISQFVMGTVVNCFAGVAWATPSVGCAIHPIILQIGAILYVVYGALFVQLFIERYMKRRTARKSPHPILSSESALKAV